MSKKLNNIKPYEKVVAVNENVYKIGDTFMVRSTIEVPSTLVNAFMKKVKTEKSPDILDSWSHTDIAEALVKYVTFKFLNIETIPVQAITGDEAQPQPGAQMVQPTAQPLVQPVVQPLVQPTAQVQPTVQPVDAQQLTTVAQPDAQDVQSVQTLDDTRPTARIEG